jgi:hypothetical protein
MAGMFVHHREDMRHSGISGRVCDMAKMPTSGFCQAYGFLGTREEKSWDCQRSLMSQNVAS